ncbi:unnamed protein product [Rotaria magnacalcarata]|uniref:HTH OST-type domain-containing protein n=1 Tax=Rotaria magnacalcarata TaxID=392030 RepID=A0A816CNP0_9BILA|nr:unnamed protein product [Rotaria magnacalcarata]CAF1626787.1 unnamed protein product [Rotaria magnacalcarata]CAF2030189.1 unnamed protein product [Rotaria magnacalcarata]CAF2061939.1 unnamed protein product [Rotaria magnacalcarata]CAF2098589.1 unnamed protein product [Rotaria magnacalcarata]
MSVSSSSLAHLIPVDPRVYCETMNELHSYITSCKRGYLTQAELFRYYRQRHDNVEIPYRVLGYRSLLDLLSSDQRLFSIDLRREPAYVYSAVKLRQQKRERRQGNATFSRQHHSTNTLDEQHVLPPDDVFFDHHVPLNEQQQSEHNVESADEYELTNEPQNERPLSPSIRNSIDTIVWHTPQSDEASPLIENKTNAEENNEESLQFVSKPLLKFPTTCFPPEINHNPLMIKCENQYKPIQRKLISHGDNSDGNRCISIRDGTLLKFSVPGLNRSISTSTTSLSKSNSWNLMHSYIFLFTVVVSVVLFSVYFFKLY